MRVVLVLVALLAVGAVVYFVTGRGPGGGSAIPQTAPVAGGTEEVGFFITPSGKIVCRWEAGGSVRASIECGVSIGLRPPIRKAGAACAHLPYVGNRISLSSSGRAHPIACEAGPGPFADPGRTVYLRYGKTWRARDIVCTETVSGLTCRNRAGHGFFLSLGGWSVF